jgi:hypothetical protein
MKRLICLSLITSSLILAETSVSSVEINQINRVTNSNLHNGSNISQGEIDIKSNSSVDKLIIKQKDGNSAGNKIEDSTVEGINSILEQGSITIDNSQVVYGKINSKNSIKRVNINGQESTITQGKVIIGNGAQVAGEVGSSNGMGMGGGIEYIEINQNNEIIDTNIENNSINQGLITIKDNSQVSTTFKIDQLNRITTDDNPTNELIDTVVNQGRVDISNGTLSEVEQTTENIMGDLISTSSKLDQSTIKIDNSTLTNFNNDVYSYIDDKNKLLKSSIENNSSISQSRVELEDSQISNLQRYDRDGVEQNNWIDSTEVKDNSEVKQSAFIALNSQAINTTYNTHESGVNATNLIYNSHILNSSKIQQDVTTMEDGADISNNTFKRANTINSVTGDNSKITQFNITISGSTLENSNLSQQGLYWNVDVSNSSISQGETKIVD